MNRKIIALLFFAICLAVLAACSPGEAELEPETIEVFGTQFSREWISEHFFMDTALSSITSDSWDDPSQIQPELLISFYANKTDMAHLSRDSGPITVQGGIVEEFIQLYFDVDASHIRGASYYDEDSHTYEMPLPIDIDARPAVIEVYMEEPLMHLYYGYYGTLVYDSGEEEERLIRDGTLTIEFYGDMHNYKYIECDTIIYEYPF